MPRGTFAPPVMNAEVISRIPATVPPIRIGFSRLGSERTLAIDVVALIASSFPVDSAGKDAAAKPPASRGTPPGDSNEGLLLIWRTWCDADVALAERPSLIANGRTVRNRFRLDQRLDSSENLFLAYALVCGDRRENRIQCSDTQRRMCRNGNSMMSRLLSLKNDVAADLVNSFVFPPLAEMLDEFLPAQIARQLHATASTSSRTSRSRIDAGGVESK